MKSSRTATGLLLLVVLASLGGLLFFLPEKIVEQYDRVAQFGRMWVIVYFSIVGAGAALMLGCSGWIVGRLWRNSRRKELRDERRKRNPSELSASERQRETDDNLAAVKDLQGDPTLPNDVRTELETLAAKAQEKRVSQTLELVAFGTISSGKSSLLNALVGRDVFQTDLKGGTTIQRNEIPWPGTDRVVLVDTPGLGEVDGEARAAHAAVAAQDADLVLLVVDGPLRDSEFQLLEQLGRMEKRVIICLNKTDWYEERERRSLLGQLVEQARGLVVAEDIVAVRSQPTTRPRIRVLAAGEERTEAVEVPANIEPLAERMLAVIQRDGHDLLLANLLLQSRGLMTESRRRVSESLNQRARDVVEKYMWAAGAAAALSPTPVLDLLAGGAITTKMVVDLAAIYRQDVDTSTAVNLLGQLGKNLVAILGTSAATPAVASAVGSMLKTIPGAGTIAGGALQGIVQAIVTRWIGAVFMQYFQDEMQTPPTGFAELAREQWRNITSLDELRKLVQAARSKFWKG